MADDKELWKTLGELSACSKTQAEDTKRLFELFGEVKDSLSGIDKHLANHTAEEEGHWKTVAEMAKKLDKLEVWKDRGLLMLGAVGASGGGIGALAHHMMAKIFTGGNG